MLNTMPRENVENLKLILSVIRKTTKAIKLFPFLYMVLLLTLMPFISFGSIEMTEDISGLIYMPLVMIIFLVYLSYCVKLCKWHRLQCVLPLIPQVIVFIDENVYEFSENIAIIFIVTYTLLFILSLINAYFVFIKPTQKRIIFNTQSSRPITNTQSSQFANTQSS